MIVEAALILGATAAFLAAGIHEHRLQRQLDAVPRIDHMRELRDAHR